MNKYTLLDKGKEQLDISFEFYNTHSSKGNSD